MRRLSQLVTVAVTGLALLVLLATAQESKPAGKPDKALLKLRAKLEPDFDNWSPEYVFERCAEHLATVNKYDRPRIRYFDMSDVPRQLLPVGTASLFFGSSSTARVTVTFVPRAVPNTDNRIFWIDLAWFNWTYETWENISAEDPYFREPIIPSAAPGLTYLKEQTNANPVIRWSWLCFYAFDNSQFLKLGEVFNQHAFYYQLVYSSVEFWREVDEITTEKVTEYQTVKKTVYDPRYGNVIQEVQEPVTKTKKVKKKIRKKVRGVGPVNAKELRDAWKVDVNVLKDFPIDQGAMIGQGKSGVSYENRILWRLRTPIGVYWRTFDVLRSVGDQDFVETPFPKKFDAGEHIIQDNRGAQFYHLTNGQDASVDFGDPRVVKDHVSGARVLVTSSSCMHCHDNGILGFKNEHRRLVEIGVKLKSIDPNRAERFSQFYLQDDKMARLVADDQRDYAEFVKDCNGLTTAENSAQIGRFRRWYAGPVNLEQAARDIGADPRELADAIGYQGTKGRLGAMVLDNTPIPRQTWERGQYAEAALLLIEWRKKAKIVPKGKASPKKRRESR